MGRDMETVVKAKVIRPYAIELTFSDGRRRKVGLEGELYGEVFEPLRDPDFFAKASADAELGTVVWPNGADFSPEFLYGRQASYQTVRERPESGFHA